MRGEVGEIGKFSLRGVLLVRVRILIFLDYFVEKIKNDFVFIVKNGL